MNMTDKKKPKVDSDLEAILLELKSIRESLVRAGIPIQEIRKNRQLSS
jgi:hypothetical protein